MEVDFVIGEDIAIEVKSTKRANKSYHKGLLAIAEEKKWKKLLLVSQDTQKMKFDTGVEHIYWEDFLTRLWDGEYL